MRLRAGRWRRRAAAPPARRGGGQTGAPARSGWAGGRGAAGAGHPPSLERDVDVPVGHVADARAGAAAHCDCVRQHADASGLGFLCAILHSADGVNRGRVDALPAQPRRHALPVVRREPQVVLDLLHRLAPVRVRHQHAAVGRVGRPALAAGDVPCVADHELEVVVVVDGCADVVVVVDELLLGHLTVHLAADVEGVEELAEDLVRRLPARHDVRVLGRVVALGDLVRLNDTVAVLVQHIEGHVHEAPAAIAHRPPDATQQLFKVDAAVAVPVEEVEERAQLLVVEVHVHLRHGLLELVQRQRLAPIVVHDAEAP